MVVTALFGAAWGVEAMAWGTLLGAFLIILIQVPPLVRNGILLETSETLAQVQLTPQGDATRLSYVAKANVGGKLAQIGSRLIDGTFPDYERVIPKANDKVLTLDRADFQRAVDRVSTISSDRGRAVNVRTGLIACKPVEDDRERECSGGLIKKNTRIPGRGGGVCRHLLSALQVGCKCFRSRGRGK